MTEESRELRSLRRRLIAAGGARRAVDALAGRVPLPGPLRPGLPSVPRAIERALVVGSDLAECVRTGRIVPFVGEPRQAMPRVAGRFPQHPNYIVFGADPSRHAEAGLFLAVDLIHHAGRFYVLEVNLDGALRPDRRALYDAPIDPVVGGVVAAAREGGFRRVVLHRYFWHAGYPDEVERAGREAGIEAIATSLPSARHRAAHPMGGVPFPLPRETMYVFFSSRNAPVDYFVHDKRWSGVWLREGMEAEPDAARRILPVPTYDTPDLPDFSDDPRWPNLVAKLTDWDGARYVRLARVRDAAHAREVLGVPPSGGAPRAMRLDARTRVVNFFTRRGRAVYQPFIPYPTDREGRAFTHRLHLLVTPSDVRYLSSHNFVAPLPAPERLPYGLVKREEAYVLSPRKGATYRLVEGAVEEELREAARWIGLLVRRAIEEKFEVTWAGEAR